MGLDKMVKLWEGYHAGRLVRVIAKKNASDHYMVVEQQDHDALGQPRWVPLRDRIDEDEPGNVITYEDVLLTALRSVLHQVETLERVIAEGQPNPSRGLSVGEDR